MLVSVGAAARWNASRKWNAKKTGTCIGFNVLICNPHRLISIKIVLLIEFGFSSFFIEGVLGIYHFAELTQGDGKKNLSMAWCKITKGERNVYVCGGFISFVI